MITDSVERREFFRIQDRLLVELREISNEESSILEKDLQNFVAYPAGSSETQSKRSAKPTFLRDDLRTYLEMIDRKLSMIIDLLTKKADSFQSKYMDVNISGAGIHFALGRRLNEGTYLELRIILPCYPNHRIAAIGRVVHSERKLVSDEEIWEIGTAFVAIREEDRDVLINYVFSKERECLAKRQTQ